LKREGKNLINESIDDFSELLGYSRVLNAHLEWEACYYYLDLLDQLMEEKICFSEFSPNFIKKIFKL
jgi:hypothetical protein